MCIVFAVGDHITSEHRHYFQSLGVKEIGIQPRSFEIACIVPQRGHFQDGAAI